MTAEYRGPIDGPAAGALTAARRRGLIVIEEGRTPAGMDGRAVFSGDRAYRYSLTRRWHTSGPSMTFIGLNPSTAGADRDDNSAIRCAGFAGREGCSGFTIVNVFGRVATRPVHLADPGDPVGPLNLVHVIRAVTGADRIVACWGATAARPGLRRYLEDLVEALDALGVMDRAECFGLTDAGHPRHPLYLPAGTPLVPLRGAR